MYLISQPSPLLFLPRELQYTLLPFLPYPDVLALKHTCRHFYNLINSTGSAAGIKRRVAWLVERHVRGLPCPHQQCQLETDESFCRSGKRQVSQLIESRRRHEECQTGHKGCEVVVGSSCEGSSRPQARWVLLKGGRIGWQRYWSGWGAWIIGLLLANLGIHLLVLWIWLSRIPS